MHLNSFNLPRVASIFAILAVAIPHSQAQQLSRKAEDAAKASGRWDTNFANDLQVALLKLSPENLLTAGEATSLEGMMSVLATGKLKQAVSPDALGDIADDLVYTT